MSSEEVTVSELTRGSGVTQGAVSQHLRALKEAGLVADRPAGRNIYYRVQPRSLPADPGFVPLRRPVGAPGARLLPAARAR